MKNRIALVALVALVASSHAWSRDSIDSYSIADALNVGGDKLGDDVSLYFADQPHPAVIESKGTYATNKKTNAFAKSDLDACQHVFLSAVIGLQNRARMEGGNAVINIKSNYRNEPSASQTEFLCGSGAIMAGVALTGEVVKLKK